MKEKIIHLHALIRYEYKYAGFFFFLNAKHLIYLNTFCDYHAVLANIVNREQRNKVLYLKILE